jgi:hypothetical protein
MEDIIFDPPDHMEFFDNLIKVFAVACGACIAGAIWIGSLWFVPFIILFSYCLIVTVNLANQNLDCPA